MARIGVIVPNLTPSQLNYEIIKSANQFLSKNPQSDFICFAEEDRPQCLPANFAVMEVSELWGFPGSVISTTLSTTKKALQCPSVGQHVFFVWDMEWIRQERKRFRDLHSIYSNPRLKIVVRSQDHADLMENAWNRKVDAVMPSFDIVKLLELVGDHNGQGQTKAN